MHVVVAGASGATGSLVVRQALTAGHRVTALVRDPSRYSAPAGCAVRAAQVVEDASLALPEDADVVISSIGGSSLRSSDPICSVGTRHLVEALARRGGPGRIVVTSASPVLTHGAGEPFWHRHVVRPLVRRLGRPLYADIAAMEEGLRASGPDCAWTIVRPGRLLDAEPAGYRLVPEANGTASIGRADLASALLEVAADDGAIGRSFGIARGRSAAS